MSGRLAVGVDAGGTSTLAAASRGGRLERTAMAGPANPNATGAAAAAATIAAAVRNATDAAEPDALYVGAAGAARADVASALVTLLRASFPRTQHLIVAGDAQTSLRAAIPAGPGAVAIAGTGAVVYAENGERRALAGGYGWLLGDDGSAYAIGLHAVKLLTRVYDGSLQRDETTGFVELALGCNDRESLLAAIYGNSGDVTKIAGIAAGVVSLAGRSDRAASNIVREAATRLAAFVGVAVAGAGLVGTAPAVALAGGLLREDSVFSAWLAEGIGAVVPDARIVRLRDEPVRAALRFAEAMLGE